MKVLRINSHFLLPDDFEGTFDDALKMLREYRKSHRNPSPGCGHGKPIERVYGKPQTRAIRWAERFLLLDACRDFARGLRHSGIGVVLEVEETESGTVQVTRVVAEGVTGPLRTRRPSAKAPKAERKGNGL